jgi:hypothetical protein
MDTSGLATVSDGRPVLLRISDLVIGGSPRLGGVDDEHVRLLAELTQQLPPILVHRRTMRVLDGVHRVRAAQLRGHARIEAEFHDGNEQEAFLLAVERNIAHGLPLSLTDRKAAAARILAAWPHRSDRAIAASTGLSDRTVRTIRQRSNAGSSQSNARVGQDGRVRPMSTVEGRLRAWEIMRARPETALRAVAESAGVSLGTVHDVRERMRRGENPVPARQASAAAPPTAPPPRQPAKPAAPSRTRDVRTTLDRLRRDPSLRFTENGRSMLRWLGTHTIAVEDWQDLLAGTPAHCAEMIADLAWHTADAWQRFARELEQRES